MDFSEIIVAIIIGAVILAINSVGFKKQQSSKNQPQRQPNRNFSPEEQTPAEEREEMWGTPPTLSLDDIFNELRRTREEEERKAREEADDYIPRAPKSRKPQPQAQARPQNLEHRRQQVEWRPKPHPVKNRPAAAEARPQQQPQPAAHAPTPEEEGTPAFARTEVQPQPLPTYENNDSDTFDVSEIDWRKAVIASEILNRKY